jgi:uncharacterized SAM-binding protein YcdF (DUF218 family)
VVSVSRRSALRWVLGIIAAFFVLVVLYVGSVAWEVRHYARADQARKVDAIVVMGAAQYNGQPSAVLRARLDHAAALWEEGYAPYIVVTGGKIPGDTNTEASASAAYLGTLGVPDEDVLREVQGRNSWQSLKASALFMQDRDIQSVLLVSDSFHDARIRQMANDLGLDAYVSPTTTSPITGATRQKYLMKEVVALSLGKVIGFNRISGLETTYASE